MNNLKNSVQLIGHLGKNPELIELQGGKKLAKVTIATKDIYNNSNGEKIVDTQWHNIIAWGKTAELMEVLLRKGNEVAIHGKIQHQTYEDKNGIKRYMTQIQVNEFMLLNKAKAEA